MEPKVCYILTYSTNTTGGIETVVKNLSLDRDVKWLGCGGACSLIRGFFAAIKIRFSDYDIIHANDNAGYWVTRLARNKKIIWTAQGLWKNYFEENPPAGWKKRLDAWILLRMQSRLIKKSDAVVAINKPINERLIRDYKISPVRIVHNGVDTDEFRPMKSRKKFEYIWVSTNPVKARLKECIQFAKGKPMLAVGVSGDSTKNLTYARIPREKMPDAYNSAKALIYISKQPDYPLVMLEAMACGIDVITTEQILYELTNLGKPGGFVNLDGKKFRIMTLTGQRARKTALDMDWKKIRAEYKKIYESLII